MSNNIKEVRERATKLEQFRGLLAYVRDGCRNGPIMQAKARLKLHCSRWRTARRGMRPAAGVGDALSHPTMVLSLCSFMPCPGWFRDMLE